MIQTPEGASSDMRLQNIKNQKTCSLCSGSQCQMTGPGTDPFCSATCHYNMIYIRMTDEQWTLSHVC